MHGGLVPRVIMMTGSTACTRAHDVKDIGRSSELGSRAHEFYVEFNHDQVQSTGLPHVIYIKYLLTFQLDYQQIYSIA